MLFDALQSETVQMNVQMVNSVIIDQDLQYDKAKCDRGEGG